MSRRFPLLDGVRALAALGVLATHVAFVTGATVTNPVGPELARLNTFVSIFFVLSGFLLYRPFVAARLAAEPPPDAVPYLWRRALRIYPAHWVATVAALVLLPAATLGGARGAFLYPTLGHVFSAEHFLAPVQQAWTLGVEVCFYLFLPAWAWFVRRLPGPVVRTELAALAGLAAAGVGYQLAVFALHDGPGPVGLVARNLLPAWFDHFAVGMGLAVLHAAGRRLRVPAAASWAVALGALLVMSRGLGIPRSGPESYFLAPRTDLAVHVLGIVLGAAVLLPAVWGEGGPIRRVLAHPVAVWLGVVSYGVYLWHEIVLDRFVAWRWRPFLDVRPEVLDRSPAPFALTLVAVLAASAGVAVLSWYGVERPVLGLKDRVRSAAQVLDGGLLATRLAVLTVIGLVVRVAFVLGWRRLTEVGGDPYWYHHGANLLADGEGFVDVFAFDRGLRLPGADHPPGYLVALALPSLVGLRSLLAHQLWTCLIGAAAIPFAGLAAARLAGRRAALLAAAITALSPAIWVYDALLHAESLAITAIAAATWLTLRARGTTPTTTPRRPSTGVAPPAGPDPDTSDATPIDRSAGAGHGAAAPTSAGSGRGAGHHDLPTTIGLGAALGVLALARAEAILLVPVFVLVACRRAWRPAVITTVAAGVLVVPWVGANLVRFDRPATLSTQLGTTLLHANCDPVYFGPDLGWWNFACAADLPLPPGDRSVADAAYRTAALDYVGDHLGRLPVVVAARVGRTFGLYDPRHQASLDQLEGRPHGVAVAGMAAYYATAVAAIVGWRRLRRAGRSLADLAPVWTPVALVLLTVVAFYGTTRFRAVAEPALAVLAAVGLTRSTGDAV